MSDTREEMRRLINVIEKGAATENVELAVADIKMLANAVSALANKLDTRLRQGAASKRKASSGVFVPAPTKPMPISKSKSPPTSATEVNPYPQSSTQPTAQSGASTVGDTSQVSGMKNVNTSF